MSNHEQQNGPDEIPASIETRATGFNAVEEWQSLSEIYETWFGGDLQSLEAHLTMLAFIDDAGFSLATLAKVRQFIAEFRAEESGE